MGVIQLAALTSFLATTALYQFTLYRQYYWIFPTIFLFQWLLIQAWQVLIYPNYLSPLRHLPEPAGGTLFMGQFSKVMKEQTGLPMKEWVAKFPDAPLIRYKMMFNQDRVLVLSPKALAEVLVTKNYDFVKPEAFRTGLSLILGVGILLAEGDEHKIQRKHLLPAFAFRHIKELYPIFWAKSRQLAEGITAEVKSKAAVAGTEDGSEKAANATAFVEMPPWLSRCTLDMIVEAGFGAKSSALENPETELVQTYNRIFTFTTTDKVLGLLGVFVPNWILRSLPLPRNGTIHHAASTIRSVSTRLIADKQQTLAEKGELVHKDILSIALNSGVFSTANLADQLMTFLAAGHETTATASAWALIELARHRDIQARLRAEIRAALPPLGGLDGASSTVTAEQIDALPLLHGVASEVLRLYSPVRLTRRVALHDTSIAGEFIPKGMDIILCPAVTNTTKEWWGEDADEFRPERWFGANRNSGGATSNFALLTFLHGKG